MKKGTKSIIVFVLILAMLLFTLKTDTVFSAQIMDNKGLMVHEQDADQTQMTQLTQSIFGQAVQDYLVQSTIPIDQNKKTGIFRAKTKNPFTTIAILETITVYKNGQKIDTQKIQLSLDLGEEYQYRTKEINLEGKDAQKNSIVIEFKYSDGQESITRTFKYEYLSLTECMDHEDCKKPTPVCDVGNQARFSNKPYLHFCTVPCPNLRNDECPEGQVCRKGFCGY